jgi:4-aminobutyrate aminotransferase
MSSLWNRVKPEIIIEPHGPEAKRILGEAGLPEDYPQPVARRAGGVFIEDVDGNVIMDFISGRCTVNVGYGHPRLLKVLHEQADKVTHGLIEERFKLERELSRIVPGPGLKKILYAHSGSAANDAAIKVARWVTGRPYIIAFTGAYHGVTYGAMAVSSYRPEMVRGFGPHVPGVHHMPYPYCFRCPMGNWPDVCELECLSYIENYAFRSYLPPDEVAAVIVEPVAGDAGWHVPPKQWMKGLAELCSKHGILLISEEVQTGFGRMGEWFGIQHFGVDPDMVVMGKAMAGGVTPMSGVTVREDLLDRRHGERPSHGHTMGGHPVGVATALENIEIIRSEQLLDRTRIEGEYLKGRLVDMWEEHPIIGDVRGVGLLIGVEIVDPEKHQETDDPAPGMADEICRFCFSRGLWTIRMGAYGTGVLRIAPPLVTSIQQLDIALDILTEAIAEAEKKSGIKIPAQGGSTEGGEELEEHHHQGRPEG